MILIGQYDSPFVRRVAIAMRRYEMPFEHRPWSVWTNADELGGVNPLRRVPTLILDEGVALTESWAILDVLDELAGPQRALLPRNGPVRREGLRLTALATGLVEKAVSLFYERLLHEAPSPVWIERCERQIVDTLSLLEVEAARCSGPFWLGGSLSHADIAVTCAVRFTTEGHPGRFDLGRWPRLALHASHCEALEDFQVISQPITVAR